MTAGIRALIVDFGGVLTRAQPATLVTDMAQLVGAGESAFLDAYWVHRRDYDLGLAANQYWARVLGSCGVPRPETRDGLLSALIALDAASWMDYREAMWEVVAAFRKRGGRTAMLSNGVPEVMARVRADRPLERWFDVVVVSCELGVVKPSSRIYQVCLTRLGVEAEEALFVDDRQDNVDTAVRLGLDTIHFRGDPSVALVRERFGLQ